MNKKTRFLMLIAVIVTSISTGYSLETTTTTVQGKPVPNAEQAEAQLNPEIVTELLSTDSVTTTETVRFHIEFKGVETMLNQITRIMDVKQKDDSN